MIELSFFTEKEQDFQNCSEKTRAGIKVFVV